MSQALLKSKEKKTVQINVNRDWCKGCGICVELCPKGVWALDEYGKAYPASPEKCTSCMFCEEHCPDYAISIGGAGGD